MDSGQHQQPAAVQAQVLPQPVAGCAGSEQSEPINFLSFQRFFIKE